MLWRLSLALSPGIDVMVTEAVSELLETIPYSWLITQEDFIQVDVQNYIVPGIRFYDLWCLTVLLLFYLAVHAVGIYCIRIGYLSCFSYEILHHLLWQAPRWTFMDTCCVKFSK
jgi:hypothetical protein